MELIFYMVEKYLMNKLAVLLTVSLKIHSTQKQIFSKNFGYQRLILLALKLRLFIQRQVSRLVKKGLMKHNFLQKCLLFFRPQLKSLSHQALPLALLMKSNGPQDNISSPISQLM